MTHENYKEMLTAHALSALDEGEARALDAHLQSCPDCRREMDQWQESAALLALATEPLEPSPELRARIIEGVRTASAVNVTRATLGSDGNKTAPVIKLQSPRRAATWTSMQRWGALAASLLFVALIISLIVLWQQNTASRNELARLSKQIHEAEQQLAREREAIAILTTPGARLTELAGTNMAPSAHAMLAYDKNGRAILMAKGLPPTPAGKVYQLWFIAGNQPLPGKVFTTASGDGTLSDQVPPAALSAATFAITLEPEAGMKTPTGAIYLSSGS